jgi:hypothetical protein
MKKQAFEEPVNDCDNRREAGIIGPEDGRGKRINVRGYDLRRWIDRQYGTDNSK